MKVLMTARHPGGGIKTFFRYIYSNPAFEDVELSLIAPDNGLSSFFESVLPKGRIQLHPVENDSRSLLKKTRELLKTENQYDLLHSHGFTAGALSELARLGVRRVPHLMTAHDVFLHQQFLGWKGRLKHFGMARLFSRLDGVHTVTEDAERNFLKFFPGLDHARIHGILHGVDTAFFKNGEPRDLRSEFNLPARKPLIGFFGRFMAQKGFRDVIEAMRIVIDKVGTEAAPLVVTFGWGGFIREDYQYIEEQGLSSHFRQLPATDDMPGSLKAVDLVVMPSRWEACGLLAMEALAAGVPIVGTDCEGLDEVLRGTPATKIKPYSPDQLAEAVMQHLEDSRLEAFTEYQSTACERFAIDRPARELRTLYDGIAR